MFGMSMYPLPLQRIYPPFFIGKIKSSLSIKICGLSSLESCLHRMRTSFCEVLLKSFTHCLIYSALITKGALLKSCFKSANPQKSFPNLHYFYSYFPLISNSVISPLFLPLQFIARFA